MLNKKQIKDLVYLNKEQLINLFIKLNSYSKGLESIINDFEKLNKTNDSIILNLQKLDDSNQSIIEKQQILIDKLELSLKNILSKLEEIK